MGYGYGRLIGDTKDIKEKFEGAKVFSIGKSHRGRKIVCAQLGEGHKKLMLAGAFHGMEDITARFLVKFTEEYLRAAKKDRDIFGRSARLLLRNVTMYIVPMVNPDGVEIALGNGDTKIAWQANARGVDINHNFDADWKSVLDKSAPSKYGGEFPESENETKAIVNFIRRENINMLLCFHSQGEEIYYDFNGKTAPRSEEIARAMAEESGYEVSYPEGTAAFGGCKDWFIDKFSREGFTIEMGRGTNPLPDEMMNEIFEPCARIILIAMEKLLQ